MPWRSQIYTMLQPCYFSCHRRDKSKFNIAEILVGSGHWSMGYFWFLELKLLGEKRQYFDNTLSNIDIIFKTVSCWKIPLHVSTFDFFFFFWPSWEGSENKVNSGINQISLIFFKPLLILTASGFHSSCWVVLPPFCFSFQPFVLTDKLTRLEKWQTGVTT